MTQITAKIIADQVQRGIRNIGQALPNIGKKHILAAMKRAKKTGSGGYSSGPYSGYNVPPRGAYVRTGTYGKSFDVIQDGLSVRLVSEAYRDGHPYSVFVGGDARGGGQASVHAGRWPKIADAVDAELDTLLTETDADLSRVIRQQGLGGEAGGL